MAEEDADIVKIATMANSFSDNMRMINLVQNAKVPTIGICMGEIGIVTRLLANRLGSPFTYATFAGGRKMAPGQLDWKEMIDLYQYDKINAETEFFGVIADPVAHSYSPLIHNRAFQAQGINARYFPFRVTKSDLYKFMGHARELGDQRSERDDSPQGIGSRFLYTSRIECHRYRRGQYDGLS